MTVRNRSEAFRGAPASRLSAITAATPELIAAATLTIETGGPGFFEFTCDAQNFLAGAGAQDGTLLLFLCHTSASLVIQENADADVRADLDRFFARLVPDGDSLFRQRDEGSDDMPAHVRAALTATQLSIPIADGELVLGRWQAIYLWEHRLRPHRRELALHLVGE